jgi:hypothetical protein
MTVAAVDRLVDHSTIIQINGESYRRKRARRLGRPTGCEAGPIRSQPDGCAVPGSLHPSSISSPLMSCAKAAMPSGPIRSLSQ